MKNLKLYEFPEEKTCPAIEAASKLFYIISYKHSSNGILTFWRGNNAGYTTDLRKAGIYTEDQIREKFNYYNHEHKGTIDNKAVSITEIAKYYQTKLIVERNDMQYKKHLKMIRMGILYVSEIMGKVLSNTKKG